MLKIKNVNSIAPLNDYPSLNYSIEGHLPYFELTSSNAYWDIILYAKINHLNISSAPDSVFSGAAEKEAFP
jgi:hypothetical protein